MAGLARGVLQEQNVKYETMFFSLDGKYVLYTYRKIIAESGKC